MKPNPNPLPFKGWLNVQQIKYSWQKRDDPDLKGDLSGHGEAVGDVGLLVLRPALPAVQLHAPAAGQQHLPVHLY